MKYHLMCKVYIDVGCIKQLYHVCPPVRKIIHSLKLVYYLHLQADNPWYNCYLALTQLFPVLLTSRFYMVKYTHYEGFCCISFRSLSFLASPWMHSHGTNRGSHMSAHVLLNLLNELRKRDKMRGLPSILSLFRNEFNKFNKTRA